jgi:hypothetical protein
MKDVCEFWPRETGAFPLLVSLCIDRKSQSIMNFKIISVKKHLTLQLWFNFTSWASSFYFIDNHKLAP